jgi:hypothetical protein
MREARRAFLGLCEEDLVKGIPSGNYAASKAKKTTRGPRQHYWLKKRKAGPEAIMGTDDPIVAHNSQIDNLMALLKNG